MFLSAHLNNNFKLELNPCDRDVGLGGDWSQALLRTAKLAASSTHREASQGLPDIARKDSDI